MDCPRDWPETIVPVQSLSDEGSSVIPERYIKRPCERPALETLNGDTGSAHVPVIDLTRVLEDNAEGRAAVRVMAEACREWGFFQAVNHGVSAELTARAREVWRGFFGLPMEAKQRYANSPATFEGYGSRLGVEKGGALDWGDYFFLNLLPECTRNYEKWPALPLSCRETTEEYGREVAKLCGTVMKALSLGMGLDAGDLLTAFGGEDNVGAGLRVNYYPKCPQPGLTLGVSPHSDPGGLTVLLPDDHVRGLQVRRGDSWVTVQHVPDAFIVNMGDQIQIVSNATYKSVEHRVVVNSAKERISLAFFYNPRADLPIGPAQQLVTPDRPPLYKSITFNEYRLQLRMRGPRGKSHLDSLKLI